MKHIERAFAGNNFYPFYIIVVLTAFVVQAIVMLVLLVVVEYFAPVDFDIYIENLLQDDGSMDKNIILLSLMIPFAISLLGLVLLIKVFHKRSFSETINGTKTIRWNRSIFGFAIWIGMMTLATVISYITAPSDFTFQFELVKFAPLLIISLLLIPLQTTFEEVLIRGYIAQGVGTLTKSRWMILLVPSLTFAFLHINNPEVSKYGDIMFFNYLAMALIWGIICILDDGIEIAIGMHAANNIFISLFTSQKGAAFETYSVFEVAEANPYVELAGLLVMGTIAIAIFYKKYNWHFSTFNKKIENNSEVDVSVS